MVALRALEVDQLGLVDAKVLAATDAVISQAVDGQIVSLLLPSPF